MDRLLGAVEAGGTKFRVAVVDPDLTIVDQIRLPTTSPEETLAAVAAFLGDHPGVAALGIASFGPLVVDPASPRYGSIARTPKPGWTGAEILRRLADGVGVPADILTDVEAAAVAEQQVGAGRGRRSVGYVTVGTGVGAALAVDGVAHRGREHTELGHIPIRRVDGDAYPGRCPFHHDCLEGMACGPAIAERWDSDPALLGDRDDVWDLEAAYLAQLVRVFAYGFGPDVVLFGGGVGTRPDLVPRIRRAVAADLGGYTVSYDDTDELVAAAGLGEDAGLVGAAILARSIAER